MCGIFGIITTEKGLLSGEVKKITRGLLKVSESRGKESAGLIIDLKNLRQTRFNLAAKNAKISVKKAFRQIQDLSPKKLLK